MLSESLRPSNHIRSRNSFQAWPAAEFAEVVASFRAHGQRNATDLRKHVRPPKLVKVFEYPPGTTEGDILRGEHAGG